ncbi:hypothetical protein GCM10027047_08280 [Rhodococcus aerolatus]
MHRDEQGSGQGGGAPTGGPVGVDPDRPDGFGHWGRLDVVDDDEHVVCHECGHPCRSLGAHVTRAHGVTAEHYRARHGLPPDTCLAAPRTRRRVPRG